MLLCLATGNSFKNLKGPHPLNHKKNIFSSFNENMWLIFFQWGKRRENWCQEAQQLIAGNRLPAIV
jgi:hypothetical protein